jgi:hypothetical protein
MRHSLLRPTALLGDLGEHHRQLDFPDPAVARLRLRHRCLCKALCFIRLIQRQQREDLWCR